MNTRTDELVQSGKELAQAMSNLIQDIKGKPNDTRYATYTAKALTRLNP